jgi:hypothetical protein
MDQVTFRRKGKEMEVTGKVLLSAQDGGLLLMGRDGSLWPIVPEDRISRNTDKDSFAPYPKEELGKHVLDELPKGFKVYTTPHYLICYDTSLTYAKWCGALFERLYTFFTNTWTRKGFELREPKFPLIAVIFADKEAYKDFSKPELGDAGDFVTGYYNILSNRMTMCDLTGVESRGHGRISNTAQINKILSQPDALRTVATIVHEATHQIAFNSGLHARLSDCPRWFAEGIAVYFETPDLSSQRGWKGIGSINTSRFEQFTKYVPRRPSNSLKTLIQEDRRFLESDNALDAYAEAWALTYFLINQHPKEYVSYLKALSAKKPLRQDTPDQRIDDFRKAFGELDKLDNDFLRYMSRLH